MDSLPEKEQPPSVITLGGETEEGWDATNRLDARLVSFNELKHKTLEFASWAIEAGVVITLREKLIFKKLLDCGSYLIFRNYLVSLRSRLIGACSCRKHLLCNFCASRRGIRYATAYKEKVLFLLNENPKLSAYLITFTVKNRADLLEVFNHGRGSMQALLKRRNRELQNLKNPNSTRDTAHTEMAHFTGGVYAHEIKRGEAGAWHPHIHMIALKPDDIFIDIQALKDEWFEITGDSHVINIKRADDNDFLEVFAYALKFGNMTHPDRWWAYQNLVGERLISSFGDLRNVPLPEDETDDMLDSDEEFIDILFKWLGTRGYVKFSEFPK